MCYKTIFLVFVIVSTLVLFNMHALSLSRQRRRAELVPSVASDRLFTHTHHTPHITASHIPTTTHTDTHTHTLPFCTLTCKDSTVKPRCVSAFISALMACVCVCACVCFFAFAFVFELNRVERFFFVIRDVRCCFFVADNRVCDCFGPDWEAVKGRSQVFFFSFFVGLNRWHIHTHTYMYTHKHIYVFMCVQTGFGYFVFAFRFLSTCRTPLPACLTHRLFLSVGVHTYTHIHKHTYTRTQI